MWTASGRWATLENRSSIGLAVARIDWPTLFREIPAGGFKRPGTSTTGARLPRWQATVSCAPCFSIPEPNPEGNNGFAGQVPLRRVDVAGDQRGGSGEEGDSAAGRKHGAAWASP